MLVRNRFSYPMSWEIEHPLASHYKQFSKPSSRVDVFFEGLNDGAYTYTGE